MRGHGGPAALLAAALLAGCVAPAPGAFSEGPAALAIDAPAVRPSFAGAFHGVEDVAAVVAKLAQHPSFTAFPFELGRSVREQGIPALRITAPSDASGRVVVLVDGGIHGNEVYGAESALHLAGWLVENYGRNATATRILETVDLRVVPLLNPDGRAADERTNAHQVDLNRNFDVDFGNPNPLCRSQSVSPLVPYYYAGPSALSEPETRALATLMQQVKPAIYLSHHTGRHALIRPWGACDPPAEMPAADDALFEAIEAWTREHTTYKNTGTAAETAQRLFPPGAASGSSTDWCYLAHHCVALTLEVTELYGEGPADPAAIAEEALPVSLHMLQHARSYAAWQSPA